MVKGVWSSPISLTVPPGHMVMVTVSEGARGVVLQPCYHLFLQPNTYLELCHFQRGD